MAHSSLGAGEAEKASRRREIFWGILTRKERWRLSWRGWLLGAVVLVAIVLLAALNVYSFLALSRPVKADVLVVEGWINDYAIRTAAEEFRSGGYRVVFTTGGPVTGSGGYTNDFNTYASVGAERLIAAGVPRSLVQVIPSREFARDRTYGAASVLKRPLRDRDADALNVITENAHARRSLLLFQKALGSDIKVGVIPIPNPDYDAKHWWRYNEGVRDVIDESLAYLYAKFLFSPE